MISIIIQSFLDNKVLMLAWSNKKLIANSLKVGYSFFFSRKRAFKWLKGELSTNYQIIKEYYYDCDKDTYLFKVFQLNNICCHNNRATCFFNNDKKAIQKDSI